MTSSPVTHGFDAFNATVEVAPTATVNCNCNKAWQSGCQYGHDLVAEHCFGKLGPAGTPCCFNYWWRNDSAPHAVYNLSNPTPVDDSEYLTSAFDDFVASRNGKPFAAQISFHNCTLGMEKLSGAGARLGVPRRAALKCRVPPLHTSPQATFPTLAQTTGGKSAAQGAPAAQETTRRRSWIFTPA